MKILIDSVNVEEIKHILEYYPIDGITCNPTIIARYKQSPYKVLKEIRNLIGEDSDLHVQIISDNVDGILLEAKKIVTELGKNTFIKVPVDELGLKAIKVLKKEGYLVTATAIYTQMQAILAANAGANYLAPYYNRIENQGYDALELVTEIQNYLDYSMLDCDILGASFKNSKQVVSLLSNGIGSVTIPTDMFSNFVSSVMISDSIISFKRDFENLCGVGKTMADCD